MASAPIKSDNNLLNDNISNGNDSSNSEEYGTFEKSSTILSEHNDDMNSLINHHHHISTPLLPPNEVLNVTSSPRSPIQYVMDKFQPGSIKGSIFTLIAATVGAGMLALPYAFTLVGIILGNIMVTTYALTTILSFRCLLVASKYTRYKSYATLSLVSLGKRASIFTKIVMVLNIEGTLIGMCVIVKSMIRAILEAVLNNVTSALYYNDKFLLGFFVIFLVTPLALMKDIGPLRFTSFIGFLWVASLTLGVTIYYARHPYTIDQYDNANYDYFTPQHLFEANPLIVFLYLCHPNVLPVYLKLQRPSPRRMKKVLRRSIIVSYLLYMIVANMVYLTFGSQTSPNFILNNFHKNTVLVISAVGFAFSLISVLPLYLHSLRANIYDLLYPERDPNLLILRYIVIGAVIITLAVAIPVQSVQSVLSVVGATTSPIIMFVLPSIYVWKLTPPSSYKSLKYSSIIVGIIVTIISLVSLGIQIKNIVSP